MVIDEALKNRSVIILAILAAVFFLATLSSCNSAMHHKAARDKEMATRLALEERTNKFAQEKSALEQKVKAKEHEIAELKVALEAAKKISVQDKLVSQSLKEELAKVTKLKVTLEEDLQQALVDGKKPKK